MNDFLSDKLSLNAKTIMRKTKFGISSQIFLPKFRKVDHQFSNIFS